jgi:phage terminase small subunit
MIIGNSFLREKSLLSTKERQFLYWYAKMGKKKKAALMAGYPKASAQKAARQILAKPITQKLMATTGRNLERKMEWGFEDKLKKLKKVADIAIPDEAKTIKELAPTAGIAAIAESNKMQGHYSAEKIVQTNVNVDADLQQVAELLEKYRKEY